MYLVCYCIYTVFKQYFIVFILYFNVLYRIIQSYTLVYSLIRLGAAARRGSARLGAARRGSATCIFRPQAPLLSPAGGIYRIKKCLVNYVFSITGIYWYIVF
jgi:hypothetical protein